MNRASTPPYRPGLWLGLALLFVLGQMTALLAQEPKVSAVIEPTEIRPGGFATFTITIEGGQPEAATELQLPKSVTVANPSASYGNQTNIINGVVTQSAMLAWQITSSEIGEHNIPAQEISVGGKTLKTNATKLVVKENPNAANSALDPLLTIEVAKTQFYAGEMVPVTVNLYVHRRTNLHRIGLIELPKDSFAIQRFPMQPDESQVTMGGVRYRTLSFHSSLSGLKPGKFKLGPAGMEVIVEMPVGDDRYQHPFFNQFEPRKMRLTCSEIELTVLPLPTEGKPANFNGVVGDFQMSMNADPKDVMVGDPISVELTVTGSGNFDAVTPPVLTNAEDWKQYPARRLRTEPYNGSSTPPAEQSANFQLVIIPKKQIQAIPSFEFTYFSPGQKKYVTAKTDAVPIKVRPPDRPPVEAAPAATVGTLGAAGPSGIEEPDKVPTPKLKMTDILTTTPVASTLLSAHAPLMKDRRFLMANAILGGVFVLLIAGKLAKLALGSYLASLRTPTRALWRQLTRGDISRARFYELAASFIAAKGLNTPKAQAILERHNTLNYGRPEEANTEPPKPDERSNVLAALQESPAA